MKCAACGAPVGENARTCPACGHTRFVSDNTPPGETVSAAPPPPTQPPPPNHAPSPPTRTAPPGNVQATSAAATAPRRTGKPPQRQQPSTLAGRFQIRAKLGQGGMGQVYQAHDRELDRLVAIKQLLPQLSQHDASAKRFLVEARSVAALNHPNVVQIYDIGEAPQGRYIVMEFVQGESLADKLQREGQLSPRDTIHLMLQIVRGLRSAHDRGVIHRDIKPANILIDPGGVPKLADFGLAQLAQAHDITMTGTAMGTWSYAAPEQLSDAKRVDHRADLYSCGAMMYELLTGETPRHIQERTLPEALRPMVMKCLAQQPEARYQNAQELLAALSDAYRKLTSSPPPPPPPKARRTASSTASTVPGAHLAPTHDAVLWQARRRLWSRPVRTLIGFALLAAALSGGGTAEQELTAWLTQVQAEAAASDASAGEVEAADTVFGYLVDLPYQAIFVVLGLWIAVHPLWECAGTRYRLLPGRLIVRRGLLLNRETDHPLNTVREGRVERGMLGVVLGYGDVHFVRTNQPPLYIEGVPNPNAVKDAVLAQAWRGRR